MILKKGEKNALGEDREIFNLRLNSLFFYNELIVIVNSQKKQLDPMTDCTGTNHGDRYRVFSNDTGFAVQIGLNFE